MQRKIKVSIRMKLCLSYLLIVLLPTILAGMLLYAQTIGRIRMQTETRLTETTDGIENAVRERREQAESSADYFITLNEIQQYINDLYYDESELIIAYMQRVRSAFQWFDNSVTDYRRISFFTDMYELSADGYFHDRRLYEDTAWYKRAKAALSSSPYTYWEGAHISRDYHYSPGDGRLVFSLFVSTPLLTGTMMETEVYVGDMLGDADDCALLDRETLRFLCGADEAARIASADSFGQALTAPTYISIAEGDVLVCARDIEELSAILILWVPVRQIQTEAIMSRRLFYGMLCLVSILLTALTWMLSGSMSKRIRRVTRAVESMTNDNYDVRLPVDSTDELGTLARNMNEMAERMDNLLNRILRAQMATQDAELRALQSQINPHFIYNTLEAFCMMAELNDNITLAESIAAMGELMRYSLSGNRNSTLAMELDNVRQYVRLQNLAKNDRIRLSVTGGEDGETIPLPKLLLQPLVENAIRHGMPDEGELHVGIGVSRAGGKIVVVVENDGREIDRERLRYVRQVLSNSDDAANTEDCLALINDKQRLCLLYKNEASLTITSDARRTAVRIEIPDEGEESHARIDLRGSGPDTQGTGEDRR